VPPNRLHAAQNESALSRPGTPVSGTSTTAKVVAGGSDVGAGLVSLVGGASETLDSPPDGALGSAAGVSSGGALASATVGAVAITVVVVVGDSPPDPSS